MPNSLLELDEISTRLEGTDRRPLDVRGHARAFAELTVDDVRMVASTRMVDGEEVEAEEILFRGHAAVFGSRTWIGSKSWGFWESIERSAFDAALARPDDVRFLKNHNPDLILARNTAGTMELSVDDRGLLVEARIAPTTEGRDTAISLQRRDITQMSFAFEVGDYERTEDVGNSWYKHTSFARLFDVAVVTYPAYDDTDAALRSMQRLMRTEPAPGDGASNPDGDITADDAARSVLRRRTLAARTAQAAGHFTTKG